MSATVTFEDGSTHQGDVVLGADGVHWITRRKLPENDGISPISSGKNAFRFLIPRLSIAEDAVTEKFVRHSGELIIWYANDPRIVMYHTSSNTMLSFVCTHPENETINSATHDWNESTSFHTLLEVYKSFGKSILRLLSKTKPSSIKKWKLLDMIPLPYWAHHRLALLDDSAHSFTLLQGQGAGIAMEDAADLSVLLGEGTRSDEVAERLKVYDQTR